MTGGVPPLWKALAARSATAVRRQEHAGHCEGRTVVGIGLLINPPGAHATQAG